MPTNTPNFALKTYNDTTDGTQTFLTFRGDVAGVTNSNMTKIDDALKTHADGIALLNSTKGAIPVNANYVSSSLFQATNVAGITSYVNNTMIALKLNQTITGTTSLQIDALAPKLLLKIDVNGNFTNVTAGDLVVNRIYLFRYDSSSTGQWVLITTAAPNVDNTTIVYSGTPKVIAHADTSSQASVTNTGNAVIQSIGLDGMGHVTSITSADMSGGLAADGRLTLVSGNPYPTTDHTGTTLYYTPFAGNRIALYDNTSSIWKTYTFTEITLLLGGWAANTNFDVFAYHNGTSPALELSSWVSDTARSGALVRQDGILVKPGTNGTRRFMGTIRTTSQGLVENGETKRFVWNMYNQLQRPMYKTSGYDPHDYNSATERVWNNNTSHKVEFVQGLPQFTGVTVCALSKTFSPAQVTRIGIGLDGTSSDRHFGVAGLNGVNMGAIAGDGGGAYIDAGYHFLYAIQSSETNGTHSFDTYYMRAFNAG